MVDRWEIFDAGHENDKVEGGSNIIIIDASSKSGDLQDEIANANDKIPPCMLRSLDEEVAPETIFVKLLYMSFAAALI